MQTFSRLGAMASNSSMKIIAGEFFSASSKAFRRLLSDSPASLLMISGPAAQTHTRVAMYIFVSFQCHIEIHNNDSDARSQVGKMKCTVDEEEESSSFVGDGASDERLSGSRRPVEKDATRRLQNRRHVNSRVSNEED